MANLGGGSCPGLAVLAWPPTQQKLAPSGTFPAREVSTPLQGGLFPDTLRSGECEAPRGHFHFRTEPGPDGGNRGRGRSRLGGILARGFRTGLRGVADPLPAAGVRTRLAPAGRSERGLRRGAGSVPEGLPECGRLSRPKHAEDVDLPDYRE